MAPRQIPNTQALKSKTFKSVYHLLQRDDITIPELQEWISENSPQHPFYVFHDGTSVQTICWSDWMKGVQRSAHYFTSRANVPPALADGKPPVIAILATTDALTYYTLMAGILRAGYVVFPISPRNSAEAVAHLLRKVQSHVVFTSEEPGLQNIAEKALGLLANSKDEPPMDVKKYSMPSFEDLFPSEPDVDFVPYPRKARKADDPALILHSSGTTAFPKPIVWDHRGLIQIGVTTYYGEVDLADKVLGLHGVPMYHAMGTLVMVFIMVSGSIAAVDKPQVPPVAPTPDNVFAGAVATKSNYIVAVPATVEAWARDAAKVEHLKHVDGVLYGGGPLSKTTGDYLAQEGVKLYSAYGLTEAGCISNFLPAENPGMDWEYFRFSDHVVYEMVQREGDLYEMIVLAAEDWWPRVFNYKHNGRDAYATGDVFVRHPTKPNYWKISSRIDEQIMLSTGEKTNPVPLEKILVQDPHIRSALFFGRGRFQNGVLIEPTEEYAFDPSDTKKLEEFRNLIWPTVERMNEYAPQHSRLFKEMIIVASPSKPFTYTAKGTPRRHAILKEYDPEITACYEAVEKSAEVDTSSLTPLDESSLRDFVRQVITGVMNKSVGDDDDIFQSGCDSLQATWIRNKIIQAVRKTSTQASRRLSPNLVYEAPTINSLVTLVSSSLNTPNGDALGPNADPTAHLLAKVKQYTSSFPSRPSPLRERQDSGDVILLTGTTGNLGCNILAQLSKDPKVKKVYAFNRPNEKGVERQVQAILKQGLAEDCLRAPKYQLLEGDLTKTYFGLEPDLYAEVRDSITHIIHNAWSVDWNLSLVSFEKHIQGTRNLIDLALSSPYVEPPRLEFISTIGIFRNPKSTAAAPEAPVDDPTVPLGQGYAESKWVCEHILAAASQQTCLRTVAVRVGQISGDRTGYWNEKEWVPAMVKSAIYVNCLPDVPAPGPVSWIPSYDAAAAAAEMRNSNEPNLHLVNPRPVPWRTFFEPFAEELGVPLVPYKVWVTRLRESLKDNSLSEVEHLARNPALRLLDFFEHASLDEHLEPPGIMRLETTKSRKVAPSLEKVHMTGDLARLWIARWRDSGFLPQTGTNVNGN